MTIHALSYGGGTQSTALLVLMARGDLGPEWGPGRGLALFANVGDDSEHPATLVYVREVAMPYATANGIELVVVRRSTRDGETLLQRLYRDERSVPIPMRLSPSGAPGNRSCTGDFKIKVLARELKARGATADDPATVALGISLDEYHRMRSESGFAWQSLAYPLIERRMDRAACVALIEREGLPVPPKSSCWFCLAGETEVVTRDGIAPIRDLAGRTVDLLVPVVGTKGGLSEVGSFRPVPVHAFGRQRLWAVRLGRGRSQKTIFATAEHRWLLAPTAQWTEIAGAWRTTETLVPGDQLRSLRATPLARETPLPFALAQGFVFGDGTRGQGDRPATVTIHAGKDEALLRFFEICDPKEMTTHFGQRVWNVYGLPRTWKALPDIRESRAFLLGWLAGWFAADGHVGATGQATLYAANPEHIRFAHAVCNVLGIRTSPVRYRVREGFGDPSPLNSLTFYFRHVPIEFFVLPHHRDRIVLLDRAARDSHWIVQEVEPTDRVDDVFCASVDGVGAFGLSDGLMTGNCPYKSIKERRRQRRDEPDAFAATVALERLLSDRSVALGRGPVFITGTLRPLDQAVGDHDQLDLFDGASCDIGGFCHA